MKTFCLDFDAPARIRTGWRIADNQLPNRVTGVVQFTSQEKLCQSVLRLKEIQDRGNIREIEKKLEPYKVYGAQLLDFLLENRDLIPIEWEITTYFFGTIYVDTDDNRVVRGYSRILGGETKHYCHGDYGQIDGVAIINPYQTAA